MTSQENSLTLQNSLMLAQYKHLVSQLSNLTNSPFATITLVGGGCVASGIQETDLPTITLLYYDPTTRLGTTTLSNLNVSINAGSTYQTLSRTYSYAGEILSYNQDNVSIPSGSNSALFYAFKPPTSSCSGPEYLTIPQTTDVQTSLKAAYKETYGKIKYYTFVLTPSESAAPQFEQILPY